MPASPMVTQLNFQRPGDVSGVGVAVGVSVGVEVGVSVAMMVPVGEGVFVGVGTLDVGVSVGSGSSP